MTTSNEHNNAPAVPQGMRIVPIWLLERVERSLGAFTSDEGWAQTDMDTMDSVSALIAATPATAPAQDEPFGYFRAEPFGWTDCAKDDEGAIALYERPQEVGLTDEAVNDAAKVLAERFDYPWAHMPEEGRKNMRVQARAVVEAALRAKGGK